MSVSPKLRGITGTNSFRCIVRNRHSARVIGGQFSAVDSFDLADRRVEPDIPSHEIPVLVDGLRSEMKEAAEALEFERAAELRDRVQALEAELRSLE